MMEAPGKGLGEAPYSSIIISMANPWTAPIRFCGFTQRTVTNTVAGAISSARHCIRSESGRALFFGVLYVEAFPSLFADRRLSYRGFCTAAARNQGSATGGHNTTPTKCASSL